MTTLKDILKDFSEDLLTLFKQYDAGREEVPLREKIDDIIEVYLGSSINES